MTRVCGRLGAHQSIRDDERQAGDHGEHAGSSGAAEWFQSVKVGMMIPHQRQKLWE